MHLIRAVAKKFPEQRPQGHTSAENYCFKAANHTFNARSPFVPRASYLQMLSTALFTISLVFRGCYYRPFTDKSRLVITFAYHCAHIDGRVKRITVAIAQFRALSFSSFSLFLLLLWSSLDRRDFLVLRDRRSIKSSSRLSELVLLPSEYRC